MRGSYDDYLQALGQRESTSNYGLESSLGFLGKYQMSEASLGEMGYYLGDATPWQHDYAGRWSGKDGIWSKGDFLANPAVQDKAARAYHEWNWATLNQYGLAVYAGQTLNGQTITLSGMLGGTWLVGFEGMRQFLQSGGGNAARDPYGTSMLDYIALFNDYATPFRVALGGNDRIEGGAGADVLTGGGGDDTLDGAGGRDVALFRGRPAEYDVARHGAAVVLTHTRGARLDGSDTLVHVESVTFADGSTVAVGALDDGRAVIVTRPVRPSPRLPVLTPGDDRVQGGAGDERFDAGDGNDRLAGNRGDDALNGRAGDDCLDGGDGADSLSGDAGSDRLGAGRGDDRASGGDGNDHVDGGDGNDAIAGGDGIDFLRGRTGDDRIAGDAGNDVLVGDAGCDRLDAGDGRDYAAGGDGDDLLAGGDSGDTLFGGTGEDTIRGDGGRDLLEGNAGEDVFVFRRGDSVDLVADFTPGEDRIDLRAFGVEFSALRIAERGGDALLAVGGIAVRLDHVDAHHLSAADFIL